MRAPVCVRPFSQEAAGATFVDPKEAEERVLSCIKNFRDVDATKVSRDAHFTKTLGLDSLDQVRMRASQHVVRAYLARALCHKRACRQHFCGKIP